MKKLVMLWKLLLTKAIVVKFRSPITIIVQLDYLVTGAPKLGTPEYIIWCREQRNNAQQVLDGARQALKAKS